MKASTHFLKGAALVVALVSAANAADPRVDSWFTANSGKYARLYETDAELAAGTSKTTWSRNGLTQTLPAYSGVQEIYSSSNWVYIRTTGLGQHTMGPWYNNAARSALFVNIALNQKAFVRFPRNTVVPVTKSTVQGEGGYFVDGVIMFDARDAVSYINSTGQDGNPPGGGGSAGDGIWNRDAYVNEAITFDPALAHQQNTGVYHYHANPIATRYLLGDHVDFNPVTKLYSESTNTPTKHSPIVGWAKDGFPLYGPYGYSSPSNSASGVRRMVPGFALRNGQSGTVNLSATGRHTLPAWAARAANRSATLAANEYGPDVSASFPLGRYTEDSEYLGDLGRVQGVDFDLDEYNGRFCITPEFPNGTYAYFVAITSNGLPNYPYNLGRQYYGTPTAGTVQTLAETVTTNFIGGANAALTMKTPKVTGGNVTLVWSATDGGTYRVESTTNFSNWTTNTTNATASGNTGSYTNSGASGNRFFKVTRTALANYDPVTGTGGGGGGAQGISSVSPTSSSAINGAVLTITLNSAYTMAPPPNNVQPTAVTLTRNGTTLTAVSSSRNTTTGIVTATFNLSGATAGIYTVNATFGPNTWSLTNGFTIN